MLLRYQAARQFLMLKLVVVVMRVAAAVDVVVTHVHVYIVVRKLRVKNVTTPSAVAPPTITTGCTVPVTMGGTISCGAGSAPHVVAASLYPGEVVLVLMVMGQPLRPRAILEGRLVSSQGRDTTVVVSDSAEIAVRRAGAVRRHRAAEVGAESERRFAKL